MPYETPATLEDALLQPEMRAAFRAHVKSEYSTENLDFHEAVEAYRKLGDDPATTDQQLKQKADEIYNKFVKIRDVRPGVALSEDEAEQNQQINLSGPQSKSVQDVRDNPHATLEQRKKMFDVADHGIMQLTNKDSFQRFKRSELCKNTVKGINTDLTADMERMEQLKARKAQLDKPSMGERMRAAFNGGMDKLKADNQKEIEDLQKKIDSRSLKAPKNEIDLTEIPAVQQAAPDRGVVPVMQSQAPRGPQVPPPPRPDHVDVEVGTVQSPEPLKGKLDGQKGEIVRGETEQPEVQAPSIEVGTMERPVGLKGKLEGQKGDIVRGETEKPDVHMSRLEEQEQPELEVEGIGMENMDEIEIGEGRGRSNAVDQGRPRSPSVRDSLKGQVGPKPDSVGPKVGSPGPKTR